MLLSRVDDVLDGNTSGALREILRIASAERVRFSEIYCDQPNPDMGAVHDNERLAQLNITITLCGKYFGQLENEDA